MAKSVTRTYLNKVKSLLNDTTTNIKALSNALVEKGILDSSFKNKACTAGDILAGLAEYESWHPVLMSEDEEGAAIAEFDDTNASGTAIKTDVVAEMPIKGYGKDGLTYIDPTNISEVYNSINNTTVATDRADGNTAIKRWTSRSIFKFLDIYYKYDRRKFEIPVKDIRNGLFLRKGNDLDGIVDKNGLGLYPYPEEIIMISEKKESNFIHFINAQYTDAHYGHFNGRNYNFMIVRDRERIGKLNSEGTGFETYLSVYANDVETELAYIDKKDDGEWYWNIPVPDKVYGEEMLDSMWDVRIVWRRDEPDRSFSVSYALEVKEMSWLGTPAQGTLPSSAKWSSVCYGKDKFVAVSNNSNVFAYSTDGVTWSQGTMPSSASWYSICYGKDKFVAISSSSGIFAYSSDGITWTQGTLSSGENRWSICYGKDKFVSITPSHFTYSSDGITWTQGNLPKPSSASGPWLSICYGKDKFVVVGHSGNDTCDWVTYSSDGINWTHSTLSSSQLWTSVCYGKDKFVAIVHGSTIFAYSSDGITWTQGNMRTVGYPKRICYGNGKFVSIPSSSSAKTFEYSSDGISWTTGTLPVSGEYWSSICYGNNKFVAIVHGSMIFAYIPLSGISALDFDIVDDRVHLIKSTTENVANTRNQVSNYAEYSGEKNIMYEPFLLNSAGNIVSGSKFENENKLVDIKIEFKATQGNMPRSGYWNSVCYGKDKFVAIGDSAATYSSDGITWSPTLSPIPAVPSTSRPDNPWTSVCYGKDKFVAISHSDFSIFLYSTNGRLWTQGNLPSAQKWNSVCYGKDKFVAVGNNINTFIYSLDGITWTQGNMPSTQQWYSVCYGKDKFVAVASTTNEFAYSLDGITWTQGNMPSTKDWTSVCYGKDKFVAVGNNTNIFAYSSDGITWTQGNMPSTKDWNSVCYGKDKFVAVAYNTDIFAYSSDGITWTQGNLNTNKYLYSVCYGKDNFVAVGNRSRSDTFVYIQDVLTNPEQIPTQIFKLSPDSPVLPNYYIGFNYRSDLNNNRGLSNGFGDSNIPTTTNNIYAIIYDKKLNYQYIVNLTEEIGSITSVLDIELLQNKIYYNAEKLVYCLPIVITTINSILWTDIPIQNNKLISIPKTDWKIHTAELNNQVNYQINDLGYIKNASDNKYYRVNWLISNRRMSKYSIEKTAAGYNFYNKTVNILMVKFPLLFGRDKMIAIQGSTMSNITKTIYNYDTSQVSLSTTPDYPNIIQQKRNYAILGDQNGDTYIVKLIEKYTFDKELLANPTV